jgi:hypothetical protein
MEMTDSQMQDVSYAIGAISCIGLAKVADAVLV